MAVITMPGMLLAGDHASRPTATTVGGGTLYACSDHNLIYQSDGATWSTWATLGGSSDLNAIITASSGQDIADALAGAAAPDSGNVFATMADVPGATSAGQLIGLCSYAPGSDSTIVNASNATSQTDVDATNAAVVFTAPATGNILVQLSALSATNNSSNPMYWGVREATTLKDEAWGPATLTERHTVNLYVSGISAGSHTYKWCFRMGGAGTTGSIFAGPTYGRLIIAVWAAP